MTDHEQAKTLCTSLLARTKSFKMSASETNYWKFDSQIVMIEKVIELLDEKNNKSPMVMEERV